MTKTYTPKGKCAILLAAMRAEPHRVWSVAEVAAVMDVRNGAVVAMLAYALRADLIYRGKTAGNSLAFGLRPFANPVKPPARTEKEHSRAKPVNGWLTDPDDIRIGKVVPGWTPPKMQCARAMA